MKDLADEARDDLALVITAEDEPVVLNAREDAAKTEACQYCGHCPCGCGG